MHDRYSDAELMERVRDGHDPEAFGALAARWRGRLRAYFRPLLAEPAAVEDAVQEVLLTLWSRRAEYRAYGRFEAYLLCLAQHHWLNQRRRERRRTTAALDHEPADGVADTAASAVAATEQLRLARAVATLPAGQRDVVALVVVAGLAHEAAAQRLQIPVGTVKSRLHAARSRVRAALEEDDHG